MVLLVVLNKKEEKKDKMKKRKRRDIRTIATAAVTKFVILLVATGATTGIVVTLAALHPVSAVILATEDGIRRHPTGAPSVVTGDNVYIAWWNGTAGQPDVQTDVMFRASTDSGATFGDRINLSNSSDADSWNVEIAGEGETVVVSWWETNQTSDTPVARVSNDAGETFGPLMMLAANGTLGSGEAEEIAVVGEGGGE
jgi:hypothetical protein